MKSERFWCTVEKTIVGLYSGMSGRQVLGLYALMLVLGLLAGRLPAPEMYSVLAVLTVLMLLSIAAAARAIFGERR